MRLLLELASEKRHVGEFAHPMFEKQQIPLLREGLQECDELPFCDLCLPKDYVPCAEKSRDVHGQLSAGVGRLWAVTRSSNAMINIPMDTGKHFSSFLALFRASIEKNILPFLSKTHFLSLAVYPLLSSEPWKARLLGIDDALKAAKKFIIESECVC